MKGLMVLLVSVLVVAVPWAAPARADDMGGCAMMHDNGHEMMEGGGSIMMLLHHADEIGLTDTQLAQLKKMKLQFETTRIKTGADIKVAGLEIASMVDDEKTGLDVIERKVKAQAALETGLRMAGIKAGREARALLTPDQRAKLKSVHEQMMKEMHEQMGGGMHGGMEGHEMGSKGKEMEPEMQHHH